MRARILLLVCLLLMAGLSLAGVVRHGDDGTGLRLIRIAGLRGLQALLRVLLLLPLQGLLLLRELLLKPRV